MSGNSSTVATPTSSAGGFAASSSDASTSLGTSLVGRQSVYLYGFMATVGLLAAIALGLVVRAYMVRRRYRQRMIVAIANGEVVPQYHSPWYVRYNDPTPPAKKLPDFGPMPNMWENEMRLLDGTVTVNEKEALERARVAQSEDWSWLTPISVNHIHPYVEPPPPPPRVVPQIPTVRAEMLEVLYDLFPTPRRRRAAAAAAAMPRPERPPPAPTTMSPPTVAEVPPPGSDVRVGVLIALPCEGMGKAWAPLDPEEAEVPEVCLGVMEAYVVEEGGAVGDQSSGGDIWRSS